MAVKRRLRNAFGRMSVLVILFVISGAFAVDFLHLLQKYAVFSLDFRDLIFFLLHSFPVRLHMLQTLGLRRLHGLDDLSIRCYVLEAIENLEILLAYC